SDITRGASPLGLPDTRSRAPLRRRAPFAWLARCARSHVLNATQCILRSMPVDIDAAVIENRRLSADYNVLSLAAPEIAASARPGQFVMIKTSGGQDPLLRRPFSIFEILRDDRGNPAGVSIFNKRIGAGTTLLSRVE